MKPVCGLLLLVWSLLTGQALAGNAWPAPQAVNIDIGGGMIRMPLGKHLEILRDPSRLMSLETVQTLDVWKPSTDNVPGFGFDPAVYWVRLAVHNAGSDTTPLMLEFAYSPMQRITLHTQDQSTGQQHTTHSGTLVPVSQRPYVHGTHVFPLTLEAGKTLTLYLRFDSEGSKTLDLRLWDRQTFEVGADRDLYLAGLYIGILIALMAYSIFLYSFLRERLYLYYAGYLLGAAMFFLALSGVGQPYLWGNLPTLSVYALPLGICLMGMTITPFSIQFLDIPTHSPRLHLLLKAIIGYSVAMVVLMPFLSYHLVIILTSVESVAAALLWYTAGIMARLRGHPLAGLYLIAWTLFIVGITVDAFRLWGLIPTNAFTANAIYVGSALESILLTYALAQRIKTLDDANRDAQADTRRHNQRIIESERDMQARLEAVIAEKTLELASTEDSIVAQQKLASVGVLSEGLAHELSLPAERIAARLSAARQTLGDFERWLGSLVDDDDEAVMAEFRPLFRRIDEQQRLATDGNARIQAVVRGLTAATRVGENAAQKISPLMPLSTVVSQCREAHPGLSIRLRLDEAPAISCWPDSLAEAFRQVLDNAVRAVQDSPRRGGQISIEARREDARRELVVRIEDTGIGMPPDVLQRATDPFFTTRAVGAGTGLGLTMARDIIVHHGGTLSIASTLDEGSCVTIRLPLPA